jgi:transposase
MEERVNDREQWYAGVDWASESHYVWLADRDGRRLGERSFKHAGDGLAEMVGWLLKTSGAADCSQVDVAIEVPHGPVVETLIERSFNVWVLNPKQMDRFRDRYSVAGAKDDSRDAKVMASALRTDPHCCRRLAVSDPIIIELREWSRIAEDLAAERTSLVNRLRQQLWRYFPAFLELEGDLSAAWAIELWQAVPTPQAAKRARKASIETILKRHRIRRLSPEQVLDILRQRPLTVAAGTTQAARAHCATLIARLKLIGRQIADAHQQLDTLTAKVGATEQADPGQNKQRDAVILASLPGIGRINLATLLAEASEALQRRDYHALRTLTGVAPVTRRSGKSCTVSRRYAHHSRLANAAYHWARTAAQHDAISRAKYAALRARGHSHGRALRSVADRLLNVACSMLRSGTTFNPSLPNQNAA